MKQTTADGRLAAAIAALSQWKPEIRLNETTSEYFRRLADLPGNTRTEIALHLELPRGTRRTCAKAQKQANPLARPTSSSSASYRLTSPRQFTTTVTGCADSDSGSCTARNR